MEGTTAPGQPSSYSASDRYRLRQGNCRILYAINDDLPVVTVVSIAGRKRACRGL